MRIVLPCLKLSPVEILYFQPGVPRMVLRPGKLRRQGERGWGKYFLPARCNDSWKKRPVAADPQRPGVCSWGRRFIENGVWARASNSSGSGPENSLEIGEGACQNQLLIVLPRWPSLDLSQASMRRFISATFRLSRGPTS